MSGNVIHLPEHARAAATVMEALRKLDVDLAHFDRCEIRGDVELWHGDGFRIGVLRPVEGFWRFEVSYADETDGAAV